ncbi:hypothetical protein KL933_004308 [Ogataea haglerorum]|uniref:Uncharacterized protein n=1 Tax=Ogataea haglerorum TaxID=1937702 RepID=A0AAN6D2F2_9ASCO|nr:uncharacterized protein KL911_004804 [Ogataea haglerorum]KAG7692566.1 hypothetical protein KL915_004613 [Ogataea haglerorum]KAG7692802.1 hypothetical protein KL951_004813 [Ogataea haglerorum]KAG7703513.1 hypothetical protein KL950_004741 [Ogataea haglerorum]KAG7725294.1 hypothetical protein KL933_004308 [Ogataea haglerorum]KAG7727365.1 hypothetical protein KL948_004514 [Ogataea haglerorum]
MADKMENPEEKIQEGLYDRIINNLVPRGDRETEREDRACERAVGELSQERRIPPGQDGRARGANRVAGDGPTAYILLLVAIAGLY